MMVVCLIIYVLDVITNEGEFIMKNKDSSILEYIKNTTNFTADKLNILNTKMQEVNDKVSRGMDDKKNN